MPRIRGRVIRPQTLAERRVMANLGVQSIRCPRGVNPYMVARRLKRCAHDNPDLLFLSDVAAGKKPRPPRPQPEPDTSEIETSPVEGPGHVADGGAA